MTGPQAGLWSCAGGIRKAELYKPSPYTSPIMGFRVARRRTQWNGASKGRLHGQQTDFVPALNLAARCITTTGERSMRTEVEMQITLTRLACEFGVNVAPATGLRGQELQTWLELAEDELFLELSGVTQRPQ